MANQTYAMGVGDVYLLISDTIPTDELLEVAANKIGSTSGGCTLTYTSEAYPVVDDSFKILDNVKQAESVVFKGNILTWDLDILSKLSANSTVTSTETKETLKLGTSSNAIQNIVVRFIHTFKDGKKMRVTILGNSTAGFELSFAKDAETIIPFEISALSQTDGTLCTIDIDKA